MIFKNVAILGHPKPDVYLDEFRPDYMPPAIPSDIAEELISYHKAPEVGVIIQNEFKMTRGIIEFEYYISSTHLPLEPDKIFSYGDLLLSQKLGLVGISNGKIYYETPCKCGIQTQAIEATV